MDTHEMAVLQWLQEQPEPLTTTEIHQHFRAISFSVLRAVLNSLLTEEKIERCSTRGFMETWRVRKSKLDHGAFPQLGGDDIRERNGELQFVRGLNQWRFDAIRLLLHGQSFADMRGFETAVEDFTTRGYQLTSLVAELRCPLHPGALKTWTWTVRPKIGARLRQLRRRENNRC